MTSASLSIVILTRNEESKLPACLEAIPSVYAVVVLDSGSTDRTFSIAKQRGCAIYYNPWPGFAAQRNFALEQCHIFTRWVLFVDADEIYPRAFFDWFESDIAASESIDVVMVPSYFFLRGKRLNYAPGYPIYHPRVVRKDKVRFLTNHTGHGESVPADCRVVRARIPYDHYLYDGELLEWMHRHIEKAALEVHRRPTQGARLTWRGRLSVLFGDNVLRVPARFFYHYLFRRGFLDGFAGFEFALMFTWYEATIYVQARTSKRHAASSRAHKVKECSRISE